MTSDNVCYGAIRVGLPDSPAAGRNPGLAVRVGSASLWALRRADALSDKKCFLNSQRPCDLTCKAAFEVDDPVDNVDCYFIWLAHHFGEGLFEVRRLLENMGLPGSGGPGPPGPPGPGPKGHSPN